jgi:hypothetical protein
MRVENQALKLDFLLFFHPAGSATQTSTRNSGRTCVLACFKSTGGRQGGSLRRRQGGSPFDSSLFLKLIEKKTVLLYHEQRRDK